MRRTKCSGGSNTPSSSMSSAVEWPLTYVPRKTERPVPHCCFRCANPCSSSPLQTELQVFLWDTQFVFFWPSVRWDIDEAQRWSNASSAFDVTSEGIHGVQTHIFCFFCQSDQLYETRFKKQPLVVFYNLKMVTSVSSSQVYKNQADEQPRCIKDKAGMECNSSL